MKVFVSSVISGYQEYRDAVFRAVQMIGGDVIRAEDFSASEESPQVACMRGVRSADVTVLLLGDRYGYLQQSGLSATHEEFREAAERGPVLAFEHSGVNREDRQRRFLHEVQDWAGGRLTGSYSSSEELRGLVVRALHEHQMSRATGSADPEEMHRRALEALPPLSRNAATDPSLHVIVAGGPHQEVLRPAQLDDPALVREIHREALFGTAAVFHGTQGVHHRVDHSHLNLEQDDRSVRISDDGTVRVTVPVLGERDSGWLRAIVENDVREWTAVALRFAGWLIDLVDSTRRLADVAVIAALNDTGMHPWRSTGDAGNPRRVQMRTGDQSAVVPESPRRRARAALAADAGAIAEDLSALLRRKLA